MSTAANTALLMNMYNQRAMYNRQQDLMQPWIQAGTDILPTMQSEATADLSKDPYYQWMQSEGSRNINNQLAAMGLSGSGYGARMYNNFENQLLANTTQNQWNKQAALAGLGMTGSQTAAASAGQNASNQNNMWNSYVASLQNQQSQDLANRGSLYGALGGLGGLGVNLYGINSLSNALTAMGGGGLSGGGAVSDFGSILGAGGGTPSLLGGNISSLLATNPELMALAVP